MILRLDLVWKTPLAKVAGLQVLLALRRKLHAARGRLILCNPSPQVVEVLDVTRFSFVTVIPTLGRRKVVVLDRFQAPGDWTALV
jgi:hypothetical protein